MSKGPGRVQQAIANLFAQNPGKRFRTSEIAAYVFTTPEPWHVTNISRTMRTLAPKLGLSKCRAAHSHSKGWEYLWGKAA